MNSLSLAEAFKASLIPPPMMYGESIRAKNPGYPPPTSLYLIYFTAEADGTPTATHMCAQNVVDREAEELKLYTKANAGDPGEGQDFNQIIWKEPTYVSIVLDVDDHEFYWFDPKGYDPIVFLPRKEISVAGQLQLDEGYQPNYSFFDAELDTLVDPVAPQKVRNVLRFTNFWRNGDGGVLGQYEKARFCMNIQLLVRYKNGTKWKHIIDPDTENQGPGGGGPI
jgi:hypothetical protein